MTIFIGKLGNKALHRQEVSAAAVKAKEEVALSSDLSRVLKINQINF